MFSLISYFLIHKLSKILVSLHPPTLTPTHTHTVSNHVIYLFTGTRRRPKPDEIEGVVYAQSKRGAVHVLYNGSSYTPNEKSINSSGCRTWKCSMYYKYKCRARLTTRTFGNKEYLKPSAHEHNHDHLYPSKEHNRF